MRVLKVLFLVSFFSIGLAACAKPGVAMEGNFLTRTVQTIGKLLSPKAEPKKGQLQTKNVSMLHHVAGGKVRPVFQSTVLRPRMFPAIAENRLESEKLPGALPSHPDQRFDPRFDPFQRTLPLKEPKKILPLLVTNEDLERFADETGVARPVWTRNENLGDFLKKQRFPKKIKSSPQNSRQPIFVMDARVPTTL